VDLVPHLGGGDVFGGGLGVSAGCPLDARQLGFFSWGVHHEAHASGKVALGDGWALFRRPGLASDTSGEDTEANDDGLGDQEDDQVGDVEGEHLRGGGSSRQEFHGGGDKGWEWFGAGHICLFSVERRKEKKWLMIEWLCTWFDVNYVCVCGIV